MRILLTSIFFLHTFIVLSQRTPWLDFYRQNWQIINPAAVDRWYFMGTGEPRGHIIDYDNQINLAVKPQWVGFEGAPLTFYGSYEVVPVNSKFENLRWGARLLYDRTDAFTTINIAGNWSYAITVGRESNTLYLGISPQAYFFQVDRSKLHLKTPDDVVVDKYSGRLFRLDAGIGAFYRIHRKAYLGISTPSTGGVLERKSAAQLRQGFQLDLIGGYYKVIGGGHNIKEYSFLEYSVWTRWRPHWAYSTLNQNLPISAEATVRFCVPSKCWLGLGSGTNGAVHFEIGWEYAIDDPDVNHLHSGKPRILRLGLSSSYPVFYPKWRKYANGTSFGLVLTYGFQNRK